MSVTRRLPLAFINREVITQTLKPWLLENKPARLLNVTCNLIRVSELHCDLLSNKYSINVVYSLYRTVMLIDCHVNRLVYWDE